MRVLHVHIPLLLLVAGQCAQAGKFIPVSPQQDSLSGKHLHRYSQCSGSVSFWTSGYGSAGQMYGSGSFPFPAKVLSGLE
jgi:hypothetical protein